MDSPSTRKILWNFVTREWKASCRELWADLRAVRWTRTLPWSGLTAWIGGIAVSIAFACMYANKIDDFCMPDGSFSTDPSSYNIWTISGFFQITLGFGQLSFGQAKFIDIAFDVVAGRGGQAVLAAISYQIIKRYITSAMEASPISYGTYKTLFLRDGISFTGVIDLIREFSTHRPLTSSWAMNWMVLSAIFVILFPTLISALSGYSSNNHAYIFDGSGNLMDYQKLFMVDYVIHDASRLNFTFFDTVTNERSSIWTYEKGTRTRKPARISTYWANFTLNDTYTVKRPKNYESCGHYGSFRYGAQAPPYFDASQDGYRLFDCVFRGYVSAYAANYGFFGLKQENSTFFNSTLPSPIINITATYIDPSVKWAKGYSNYAIYGNNWTDTSGARHFDDPSQATYTTSSGNETFVLGDPTTQGKCQPDVSYKWGFSFLFLFIFLIVLLVWTVGTYIMWLKARLALRHHDDAEIVGEYKAVINLASAMNNEFGKHGEIPGVLRERQIRSIMKKELNGGTMMYQSPLRENKFRFRDGFKRWLIKDKWWILAFTTSLICVVAPNATSYSTYGSFLFGTLSLFIAVGIPAARIIGRTKRSRILMLAIFLVLGLLTIIIMGSLN
ncbi:hypothetical protein E6O75_ATG06062 [Venturia nashicola]|uniref:Uncharacterized protein n=1 Tax=Venturia nashicola TaxID=86259 RepID=A0A4Z1PBH3_9PEZI|nr:hypothetical protein E6O75_ATG06062 [Venturia nashicola]